MKKLFTLVLTLAMVFAIAAPAMAAWGSTSGGTGAPFTVGVSAVVPSTDSFGNSYYNPYNTASSIVPGAPLYVMVTITVPSSIKLANQYGNSNGDFTGAPVLSNLVILRVVNDGGFMDSKGEIIAGKVKPDSINDKTTTYTAVLLVTAQNALAAKLTYTVSYDSNSVSGTYKVGSLTIKLNTDNTATITHSNGNYVTLTLGSKSLVDQRWQMTIGSKTYTVYGGDIFAENGTSNIYTKDDLDKTQYNILSEAYKKFTNDLGFSANEIVYFTDANIRANYGLNNSKSASVEYTGVGVVPTPIIPGTPGTGGSINVPNTGDSVSVLGYVMAGLAVLAAAVVVVRKVRA